MQKPVERLFAEELENDQLQIFFNNPIQIVKSVISHSYEHRLIEVIKLIACDIDN